MTALTVSQRILHGGQLLLTQGINDWISTGLEPYASEPNPHCLGIQWRQHHISVIVTSHLSGDQGDTCKEDQSLNDQVFSNPGCGDRLLTMWHRNHCGKIFCITDDFGGENACTTVLFASEY